MAGQVALIEVDGAPECLTGVVLDDEGVAQPVVVDLGASPRPPAIECEVIASFFAPDALYRVRATALPHPGALRPSVIDLRVHDIERVQRRSAPRARIALHTVLSNFDDPGALVSVVGETVDLGAGGCRVRTSKPFPPGCDPTVTVTMPGGDDVVVLGAVLQARPARGGYEYRIVFLDITDEDRERVAQVASALAAA